LGVVYAAERAVPLSGLLLLGPGLFPRVSLSPWRQALVVAGHRLRPMVRLPIPLTPELYTANPPYRVFSRSGDDPARPVLPGRLPQGEDDQMMDVPATRRWFDGLSGEHTTYRAYPGAGHTLDFEPDRSRYLADMLAWLSAMVRPGS